MVDPTPTRADRLALAVCVGVWPGSKPCQSPCHSCRQQAAAVVRELAEQVVPAVPFDRRYTTEESWNARDDVRAETLAIAAELEGANAHC